MPGIGQSGGSPAPHPDSLGVIISLPPALTAELHRWRESFAGSGDGAVPAHTTLVSGRARSSWTAAADHVRAVARTASPFTITLRGTGTFCPLSPVVYLKLDQGEDECRTLHQELLQGPVEHLLDFDFQPHLTIAHDLDPATMVRAKKEMAGFEAELEVTSIGLFDFAHGGWELNEELTLGGDGEP